jgi:hypothetical protein
LIHGKMIYVTTYAGIQSVKQQLAPDAAAGWEELFAKACSAPTGPLVGGRAEAPKELEDIRRCKSKSSGFVDTYSHHIEI